MSTQPRRDGIDVAYVQQHVDWSATGVTWAAFKATEGTVYVDPTFAANQAGTAAAGIRHRLAYHFLRSDAPAQAQAAHFVQTVGPLEVGEGLMVDAEGSVTLDMVRPFVVAVEAAAGRPCAVYTGTYVDGGRIAAWAQSTSRPLIIAAYTTAETLSRLLQQQQLGWPDAWQWAGDVSPWGPGTCPGVNGHVDCDQVDNPAAFDRTCGIPPSPPPAPTPDPSEEDTMPLCFFTTDPAGVVWIVARDLSSKTKVTDLSTLDELGKHGEVPQLTLTPAQHAQIPAVKL